MCMKVNKTTVYESLFLKTTLLKNTENLRLFKINQKRIRFMLFSLMFLLISPNLFSEIIINQRPASPFKYSFTDVWNIDIINNESAAFNVRIIGTVVDAVNNKMIYQIESSPVLLTKGLNHLTPVKVQTQSIDCHYPEIREIHQRTNSLPPGSYVVCIKVLCLTPTCDEAGSRAVNGEKVNCLNIKIDPPTPLLLASPLNRSEIDELRPMLVWIPPMPIGGLPNLFYKISLVELLEDQAPIDGILRNRPLLEVSGHQSTSLQYPFDLPALEQGKKYAWKVEAWYGEFWVATSEVWEFKIAEEEEEIPDPVSFVKINDHTEGIIEMKNILRFSFFSKGLEGSLSYNIVDSKGKEMKGLPHLERVYGENRYAIDLRALDLRNGKIYTLIVTDDNGVKKKMSFKYIFSYQ
jgi:hypothetical protein